MVLGWRLAEVNRQMASRARLGVRHLIVGARRPGRGMSGAVDLVLAQAQRCIDGAEGSLHHVQPGRCISRLEPPLLPGNVPVSAR